MKTYKRKNAWSANNGGQFRHGTGEYTDLYWYAKGVQVMQSRPVSDPTSWWFYAAIHGEYLLHKSLTKPTNKYPNWPYISYIPSSAQLAKHPSEHLTNLFWDQCQHGSWFFPPWHRGYLVALEHILRDIIINEFDGPADWALPYWNYMSQSKQHAEYNIPPAFTEKTLPDGTPNPLFVPERYGPNGDGKVFIEVGNGENQANDECQWDTIYSRHQKRKKTGRSSLHGYFYGGKRTGFSHNGDGFGDLESNPHNFVHVMVGGFTNDVWTDPKASSQIEGLMSDPPTAALDPIFYLHHANIDRMWEAWNVTGKNHNPTDANWLSGPSAHGNSKFAMPLDSRGTPWYYTPEEMNSTNSVKYNGTVYSYTYDDLSLTSYDNTPPVHKHVTLHERLAKLGLPISENDLDMDTEKEGELVGANNSRLTLKSGVTRTTVKIDSAAWKSVSHSYRKASASAPPDEVYLRLENVKGTNNSNFLSLYVNGEFVRSVALFGIRMASEENSAHGGAGLTFTFNITHIIDSLHLAGKIDIDSLDIEIKTKHPIPSDTGITVDRVGIYREGN